MSAHVPSREFARVVLPSNSETAALAMLTAYFDDSGTHGNSDIVLMAGFFANTNQWDYFSKRWAKQLASPCPGKEPLPWFHMTECQAGDGLFLGWKRHETDFLVHELGTIILGTGIYGFGGAMSRKEYERLVVGDHRRATGNAETICIINCFSTLLQLANAVAPGQEIAIVFDDRPQKKRDIQKIFDIYKDVAGDTRIISVSFASARKMLPLQAADLLAWEIYQDTLDALAGRREAEGPRRHQLTRLVAGGRIAIQFCSPEGVRRLMQDQEDPEMLAMIANHVDFA
jgi:Protein of unknown function (DUF3800)